LDGVESEVLFSPTSVDAIRIIDKVAAGEEPTLAVIMAEQVPGSC